jgi:hypothetical protein
MLSKKCYIAIAIFTGYSAFVQAVVGEVVLGTVSNKTDKSVVIRAAQAQAQPASVHMVTVQPGQTINVNRHIPLRVSHIYPDNSFSAWVLRIQSQPPQTAAEPLELQFSRTLIDQNTGQTTLMGTAELTRQDQVIGAPWNIIHSLNPGQEDSYTVDITLAGQDLMQSDIDVTTSISG